MKIIELILDEDQEEAGIDAISIVENPAIEEDFIALKNDQLKLAHQLVKVLQGVPCKVNLIPFNPFPGTPYQRSNPQVVDQFRAILNNAGLIAVTRKTRGDDIDAACGQLVGQVENKTKRMTNMPVELAL